jgi:hypothetical protein
MSRLCLALRSANLLIAACSAEQQSAGEPALVLDPVTGGLKVDNALDQRVDALNQHLQESAGR